MKATWAAVASGLLLVAGLGLAATSIAPQVRELWLQHALQRALARGSLTARVQGRDRPLLRLTCPRVGLDVVALGAGAAPNDTDALLHLAPVVLPALHPADPLVVAGHRDGRFRCLEGLHAGDVVEVAGQGRGGPHVVADLRVVAPDDLSALTDCGPEAVVLVTCYPLRHVGPAPLRLLVVLRSARAGSARPPLAT